MSRVIVVTSGKGGVGKSSFCANVGSALAKLNQKVCLIDADLGLKNLDVILGLENRVVYDIEDVIEGRVELRQALIKDKRCNCLYVLPACKNINVQKVDFSYLERIIIELNKEFDFIFIDCPAGIERGFYNAINNANEAIIVVNLDISSIRDADKVVGILNSQNINNVSVVVNRVNVEEKDVNKSLSIDDVIDILNIPLIGIVYYDCLVASGNNNGIPSIYDEKAYAGKCYNAIARRILGENVELTKFRKKSILAKIFN